MHELSCITLCKIYIDFRVGLCYNKDNGKGGFLEMPIVYKIDVLKALKDKGFSTYNLRKEKLLSEGMIQALRDKRPISWDNLEKLCKLLQCQPSDLIEYVEEEEQKEEK
jgi:putative transcriptional regulator